MRYTRAMNPFFHLSSTGFQFFVGLVTVFLGFTFLSVYLMPPGGISQADIDRAVANTRRQVQTEFIKEIETLTYRLRMLEDEYSKPRLFSPSVDASVPNKKYPPVRFLTEGDKKRILVTGGSGFVGSHLVDRLMRDGHNVIVVDNFFTGSKANIQQWLGHRNFDLLQHDIVNPLLIEVDHIYHLASPASPKYYMYNPVKTIKTNTIGTLNVLGLAKRTKARILFTSTSEVYGDPEVHPQTEDYWGHVNPIGPRACYDEGKRISETMFYAYARQDNVDVRVARIFNTYGPRMHMNDGRVVSNFVMQALKNQPLTVYGGGNQTRSFMYVSDLVDGLVLLMNSNYSDPVNLGNPDEHTIRDFAQIILEEVKKMKPDVRSSIKSLPLPKDDPHRRKPDIQTAKRTLGWQPLVPLHVGLRRTIAYFVEEIKENKHALGLLDKVNTSQNPFYVKETREAFRSFFGEPSAKDTYVKLVLGLPLYLKFAGAIIIALKRWLSADDIDEDNEVEMDKYFVTIHTAPLRMPAIGDRTLVLRDDDPIIPAEKEKTSVGGSSKSKDPNKKVHKVDKSPVLPSREMKRDLKTNSDTSPTPPVSKDPPITPPSDQEQKKIFKLHTCATCQKEEETVKTFKRCQRCRGKPNPHYYCSKECQASDWKGGHKEYHIREDTPKAVE